MDWGTTEKLTPERVLRKGNTSARYRTSLPQSGSCFDDLGEGPGEPSEFQDLPETCEFRLLPAPNCCF